MDKHSPMPMYYQIEEDLKRRIDEKEFLPGATIPSERELSERYNVSRMTVRQAVTNMVNDGYLFREKGKGTFVAERKIEQALQGMTSFTEDMEQRGMVASSQLLTFEIINPPKEIARKLKLADSDQVYKVERIRYADLQPMAIELTFIPIGLLPDLTADMARGSLYDYLEDQQLIIGKATQMIEAAIANDRQAKLLEIPPTSAVLQIERNSFLKGGIPFEIVKSSYRADRYKFISDIYRS